MPKKTRKQKIVSGERRKLLLLSQMETVEIPRPSRQEVPSKHPPEEDLKLKNYFLLDLKKSVVFILIVVALEIAVYYGTINNYFGR
ncbi:hypothetical protein HYT33_01695 [Candidatus Roizmanbacteria bacterium]|nr:hypothetical protein [Candidatus Roizmanbacteria bacterium]